MDNKPAPHPAIELVRRQTLSLAQALATLRNALPPPGAGAPADVADLRRALHTVGALVLEEGHFPARRVLADALIGKVAFPGRMAFRLGETRSDRERLHELVRAFVSAEVLAGSAWEDFTWRARLFVELHLARARYVEHQLLAMAPHRLGADDWRRLDRLAELHMLPAAAPSSWSPAEVLRGASADVPFAV